MNSSVLRERSSSRRFDYELPTRIVGGAGAIAGLAAELDRYDVTNPILVTDAGLRTAGIVDTVLATLPGGASTVVFDGIVSDPTTTSVDLAAEAIRAGRHDVVVALGGGSVLDAAKAAAATATAGRPVLDLVGPDKVDSQPVPVIAIPTTAGTGSEVTRFCVLSDPESRRKVSIASLRVMPTLAVLDPELTVGLPPAITAATGFDALGHAIESYGSVWNNPISEGHARHAVTLIGTHLRAAVTDPADLDARMGMLAASCIAELAANYTRLGLAHALAVPLGAAHGIPHGVAVAHMLPEMCAFNEEVEPARHAELARCLAPGSTRLSDAVRTLRADVGLTTRLRDWQVGEHDFAPIVEIALGSDNTRANPRIATAAELTDLLRAAA
ncbi:iron-containing alcohol dehydrogenase family protein [Actinophytocola gossypii]|uniref:Iron-containing alcohol dehydrogenase n=1 Tax=Actinophytocola gossypii TaxID=2812003 RepID=A0ABT2J1X6_9PSEU|nr:iron-containing alcohol dehydrogenase [Actinophytocola gossypii]MCT2581852.1 iron-containing alcohol dehydrogenase [Actinophytocola gossypii]